MLKICIDARFWGIAHTGIGRYIENLVNNFPGDVILIVPPKLRDEPKLARFSKYYARFHPYSFISQLEMLWILSFIRPNLLHVPHFTIPVLWPGKIVVTIHDLIKHLSRGRDTTTRNPLFYWLKYFGYSTIVWLAVHRASHIFVPAKYWKKILIEKYKISENKVSVTYEGVSSSISTSSQKFGIGLDKPYVLYVGNIYPHKDVPTLVKSIKQLNGEILGVIVCARSIFKVRLEKIIKSLGADKFIKFYEKISDKELGGLYAGSLAFVTPSLIEGFGLPGLEAMAMGTPVIAANTSCLPEIYGNAALFFKPGDADDLTRKILEIKNDPKLRNKYITRGLAKVKTYSWAKMAKLTRQVYQSILNSHTLVRGS